jgi:HlyD family secretion protein
MNRKRGLVLLLVGVAVAGGLSLQRLGAWGKPVTATLRVSGNIEVTDAEVSFRIAGKVQERLLSEGEQAKLGQVVARLETAELAQEVALRQAELRAAQAALAELEAGSRAEDIAQAEATVERLQAGLAEQVAGSRPQEIAAAAASVGSARANAEYLRGESERQTQLLRNSVISQRDSDLAASEYEAARARLQQAEEQLKLVKEGPRREQIDQARAALKEAQEQLTRLRNGPRPETVEQARARVEQGRASLGLAETHVGYASLTAPLAGVVLSDSIEAGEYVAAGTPVLTIGDLANVWLRAYIDEEDLGRVRLGQRVHLTTDTYPGKVYEGRLSFISAEAEFTPRSVQTQKERVKLVYRVKIDVPNPEMELKPGLPADAELVVEPGAP